MQTIHQKSLHKKSLTSTINKVKRMFKRTSGDTQNSAS